MSTSTATLSSRIREWDLDIDHYLNRVIPPSPLRHFPTPVARFLGYREEQKPDVGNVLGAWWSCVGAFCGLVVVAAVFNHTSSIQAQSPPVLIASFGASAVLEYNAIRSPLGQPRNAILGHAFSAIIGVGITKLFRLHANFEKIKWLAGATSCGLASAAMLLTGTVHPPGGASAVLAATSPEITEMGWYFVGLVMWGTTLMVVVGLVINNIQRQFPIYWWTPLDLRKAKAADIETWPDARGGLERRKTGNESDESEEKPKDISVSAFDILVPEDLSLNQYEIQVLETLRDRMRKRLDGDVSRQSLDIVPSREARSDGSGSTL